MARRSVDDVAPMERRGNWFRRRGHKRNSSTGSALSVASDDLNGSSDASSLKSRFRGFTDTVIEHLTRESAAGYAFLSKLSNKAAAQDAATQMRRFLKAFEESSPHTTVAEKAAAVQEFYEMMQNRMDQVNAWRDVDPEERDQVMDGLERYIVQHIYDSVFLQDDEDEQKDVRMQLRIRQLHWITPRNLDANIDLNSDEVLQEVTRAQEELLTMDAMRAPQDKLQCIVACSKSVFRILRLSSQDKKAQAADDFLPALIYILIKVNPPMLHSNMQFIERFAEPSRLMAGEAGYYYTNLMSATAYVEHLNAEQLEMSQDDFDRALRGSVIDATEGIEVIKNLKSMLDRCRNVENKQQVLMEEMSLLLDTLSALTASTVKPIPTVPESAMARIAGGVGVASDDEDDDSLFSSTSKAIHRTDTGASSTPPPSEDPSVSQILVDDEAYPAPPQAEPSTANSA